MNFEDTPEEAAFRAKVRAWLDANAPKHLEEQLRKSAYGSEEGYTAESGLAAAKSWQKKKADAGYACIHWPREYGGGGFSRIEQAIWQQEEGIYSSVGAVFAIGQGMCGPTLIRWGSEEHKKKRLPHLV